jgi:hypothetical protein
MYSGVYPVPGCVSKEAVHAFHQYQCGELIHVIDDWVEARSVRISWTVLAWSVRTFTSSGKAM